MSVEVQWASPAPRDEQLIIQLGTHGQALLSASENAQRELSIVLLDDDGIQALNARWRDEDKPTDVLSFPQDDACLPPSLPGPRPLGDVVLSLETAARQATEQKQTLVETLTFLLVHGFCHLLGHDHGEASEAQAMRRAEDRFLALIAPGQSRPPTPY